MSSQAAQLLEAFEALPEDEKRVFTVEFLDGRCRLIRALWTIRRPLTPPISC
jgi:hypothetical protein